MPRANRGAAATAALALLISLAIGVALPGRAPAAPMADHAAATAPATSEGTRPDIVMILMDDFSLDLLGTMPEAGRMVEEGASYRNAFVVDSLCCPSRASILTGLPPHLTGVRTNAVESISKPLGGFQSFTRNGNIAKSFDVALQEGGYTTGFIGKYLNGYEAIRKHGSLRPPPRIRGWKEFAAFLKGGYNEWGFLSTRISSSGQMELQTHSRPLATDPEIDRRYATNVAARKALDFIARHRDDADPYFLEVAVYAPHAQTEAAYPGQPLFPSAMSDRAPASDPDNGGNCGLRRCGDLQLTDLPGYDDPRDDNAPTYLLATGATKPAPPWRTNPISLTPQDALLHYRNRARMVQSVDRMISRIREAVGPDTYVLLTSDNGLHLGQHQLNWGKGTPYDSDTRVPLVVVGPGVVAGPRDQYVSTIDLAPTFEELAGLESAPWRAGTSLADTLAQPDLSAGRYVFVEHTNVSPLQAGPDADDRSGATMKNIPSYIAVRGDAGLLVRFDLDQSWKRHRYAWELYRYDVPWEDTNVFAADHALPWAQDLMTRLRAWKGCAPDECRVVTR